jgi:chitinase
MIRSRKRRSVRAVLTTAFALALIAASAPLSTALAATTTAAAGPVVMVDCSGLAAWSSSQVYTGGMEVKHNNTRWKAKWWTQGETPGTADVWANQGACTGGPNPPGPPPPPPGCGGVPAWSATQVYTGGMEVSHNGHKWRAKWWTQGETPGTADVWADQGSCTPAPPPPPPPPPGPPPPPPPPGSRMSAPYLYLGWGDPPSVQTVMSATGIRQFTMAFMLSGGGCSPAWDSQRPLTGGIDQQVINQIRAGGGDIEISFGGWQGNKLGPNCGSASALAGAYQQVINAYNLKYIDIDIENFDEFENFTVQDRILGALKIVKQNNPGIRTIVTFGTSTTGPNFNGTRLINQAAALGANIDNFTIMPFDFGGGANMFQNTVNASEGLKNALKSAFGWSDATAYAHMGISGMNGLSDQQELTSPQTWTQIRDWAKSKGLTRLAFWSVNRDRPCPGGGVVSNCSGISQNNWQFTQINAGF